MLFNTLATVGVLTLGIIESILTYVDSGLTWIASQASWLQLVIYAVAVILILIGLFTFLKKFIKAFLVIAIIGGILYVLDLQEILDISGIIDQITSLFGFLFRTI